MNCTSTYGFAVLAALFAAFTRGELIPNLAGALVASAEASELVSPENDGCSYESLATEPGLPTGQKVYKGQKISLDFKDAEIVNVLRILSEVGGENIVVTDDVKGRITVRLIDVPWDQAFDVILQTNHLRCVRVGNVRRVSTIAYFKEELEAQLAAEHAAEELEQLKTAYVYVSYLPLEHFRSPGVGR